MTPTDKTSNSDWNLLFTAWLIATLSTLGSLFFSEIMRFPPCVLCWYQRICLFPLVILLARGLFPLDKSVIKFALPLALSGWAIAFYHNLLYYGVIPESISPCRQGVSCAERYINLFGVFTIPMLSILSFSTLVLLLFLLKRRLSV
ncbi:MAG: disulfide bond formation protein B [Deltaproteobacteria bacterium]|nr:disulfide bond formation protein B [Deltaproteobacteria bacterium]